MGLIIGKQGSGSNIPKAPGTGEGFPCIGGDSAETWLQNAISRGITLYTTRNADPYYGTFEIIATKDFSTYKPLYEYAEELGLSQVELEELERNITAILREHNGIFNTDGAQHYAFCIALIDGMTVLHSKTPPYRLRAWYGYPLIHVGKKWQHVRLFSAWTEEAAPAEIYAENPILYGRNAVSVSLVPAFDYLGTSRDCYLFETSSSGYKVGDGILAPIGTLNQQSFFNNLFQRIDPPEFGTYRLDAWPQDVDKCRIPALRFLQANSSGNYYEVVATIPSGPVSIEQRNIDPNSVAAFFVSATSQLPNYKILPNEFGIEPDYILAKTPTPVAQGGLGPVRPGLYYKGKRLVAIITDNYYGHVKGVTLGGDGREGVYHFNYERVTSSIGVITNATSTTDIPADAKLPDELGTAGESATEQRKTATRPVRHYLDEYTEGYAQTDNHQIELRIAFTIRTGSTARLVDQYRSTTVSVEGISHNANIPWKANIGSADTPNEATLEQATDENGHKVLTIPLDKGILKTQINANSQTVYLPFQVVTIQIYARFESSERVGSFRTAPDDELDFDSYVPYRIWHD